MECFGPGGSGEKPDLASKGQAKTESHRALRRRRRSDGAGDRHEVRWRGRRRVRLIETGCIGQVESLGLEPEVDALLDSERSREPEIQVEESWTTESVQAHI